MGNSPSSDSQRNPVPPPITRAQLLSTSTETELPQSYETLPANIEVEEFKKLDQELKKYYDTTNKISHVVEGIGITINYYRKISQEEIRTRLNSIISSIISTPNFEISYDDFNMLPQEITSKYIWGPVYSSPTPRMSEKPISYKRGKLYSELKEEQRRAKEQRFRDIASKPNIVITIEEYNELDKLDPYTKQKFIWQFGSFNFDGTPFHNYYPDQIERSSGNYKKGITVAQDQANKKARLDEIRTTPNIKISVQEYHELIQAHSQIIKEFEWLSYGDDRYGERIIHGYKKGRTTAEVEADKQARLYEIRTTPNIKISVQEFYELQGLDSKLYNEFKWIPIAGPDPRSSINQYQKGEAKVPSRFA